MCVKEVIKHSVPVLILDLMRKGTFTHIFFLVADSDPGSSTVLIDPWIRIRDPGWKKSGPKIKIPGHISESYFRDLNTDPLG